MCGGDNCTKFLLSFPFLFPPLPFLSLFAVSLFSLSLSPSVSALLPLPSIQPEWSRLAADQQLSDIVVT